MQLIRVALKSVAFSFALLGATLASAQTYTYSIYVDGDRDPLTGCNVPTMVGADRLLEADVTGGASPQVIAVRRSSCVGGTFAAPSVIGGGYPVGLNNGTAGADVIELADQQSALIIGTRGGLRLAVLAQSAIGQDDLTVNANGGPIVLGSAALPIPLLTWPALLIMAGVLAYFGARRVRRSAAWRVVSLFLLASGIAVAANFIVDGQVGDWAGVSPLATDPTGDSTSGEGAIDLTTFFGAVENGRVYFRIDVRDLQSNPPIVVDGNAVTLEDLPVTISLTGTDPEGAAVTFAIATGPSQGSLGAVTSTGTNSADVTYTPNANANGSDSFTFTGSDGQGSSAPGTISISITPVNDAPGFVAGADQGVAEDVGLQTVPGWATAITAGPADEVAQTVGFTATITNTTGTLTFVTQPAIAPNGTLTFGATNGTSGIATVSVVAVDNGGTANGGIDTSAAQSFSIAVNAINHAPSFTAGPAQTVFEDAGAQTVNPWATAISDGDGNTQVLDFQITGNTNPSLFTSPPAVSPTGVLTYTTAANANGVATISLLLHDDGGTALGGVNVSPVQSFTISVTAVNDAPGFVAGADQGVAEDVGLQTVPGWATAITPGPADEVAQTVGFTATITNTTGTLTFVTQPAIAPNGTLTFGATNGTSGIATVSVVAVDNGGIANGGVDTSAAQTFSIAVNAINHAPSFTAGPAQSVFEDAGAQTVNAWATVISDGDGNTQVLDFQITGNTNPSLFSSPPAVSPTGVLTYTAAANANGVATISLLLHDDGGTALGGVNVSPVQSFTISVTAVNDAPSFVAGANPTVLESSGPATIPNWATAISAGPADESGQTLAFNVNVTLGAALFSSAPALAPNGTLTFTPLAGANGTANLSVTLQDNGGTANGGADTSAAQTFSIIITVVDDPPVAVVDSASVSEDAIASAINVLANDTDPDGGPISIASVTQPANGAVVITGGGSGLTYQPSANYCNNPPGSPLDTFSYTLTPGSSSAVVSVTVNCVDDPPVAVADSATVVEDAAASAIPVLANDTDVDVGPLSIASVTQPANGVVVITGGGTGLTYAPNPDYCNTPPGTTLDTFTYTLTPGSSVATVSVSVTCVVDDPVAVADSASVLEDSVATTIAVRANDSNPDSAAFTVASVTQPANGVVAIINAGNDVSYAPAANYCNTPPGTTLDTFTYTLTPGSSSTTVSVTVNCVDDPPTAVADAASVLEDAAATAVGVLANDPDVDGGPKSIASVTQPSNGTVVITGGGTGLTYQPNPNYCNSPPGSTLDNFTYTLTPGASSAAVAMTVTCSNDPPVVSGTVTLPVHTHIAIIVADGASGDLLVAANITDPDSSNFVIGGSVPTTSVNGGEVSINTATGAFDYNPPANFAGATDSFQYQVCDDGVPVACSVALTVTLNVSGPKIWHVDDNAVVVGTPDGTLLQPLTTFAAGITAANAGDKIFLFQGNYVGGSSLAANVELVGQGVDGTLYDTEMGITPPANSMNRPAIDLPPPVITTTVAASNAINLGNGNTIRGLEIGNRTGSALRGIGFGTLNVYDDVRISGAGQALDLTGGAFAAGSTFTTISSIGGTNNVALTNIAGAVNLGPGTLGGASGTAFLVSGGVLSSTYTGNISKTSAGLLLDISNHTVGTLNFQTGTLSANAGTGMQFNNADGTQNFTGAVTLNGGDAAIDVIAGSSGTINFANPGSTIANPTGEAVVVDSSSAIFTYAGSFIKVNNAVSGIRLSNNSGGSITFSGATKTLTTTTANAVQLATNTGTTMNFSGGGLALTTTSGVAFNATGGGTVNVSGSGNTATSTTGRALNVQNTSIGATLLTFERISSNGAPNGIRLDTTGASNGLTVTGLAAAGSGGTIQNSTGAGISLNSTGNVSLARMNISASATDGINGATVNGFSCNACVLINNGTTTIDEGMQFTQLSGVVSLTGSTFTNSAHNHVYVSNSSGTVSSLTMTGNTFNANNAATGNHAVLIEGLGGAPVFTTMTISANNFISAQSIGLQILGNNSTSMPSVTVTGNTFTNNVLAADLSLVQGSSLTFNASSNIINSTVVGGSHALNSNQGIPSTGVVQGRYDGNTIGTAGNMGSGSMIGNGIRIVGNDNGTKRYLVNNTSIRETRLGRGIEVVNRNGTGGMDATVTNNTVNTDAQPADFPLSGILVQSNCVTVCTSLRSDIASNTVAVPSGGCAFDLTGACLALVRSGATSTCQLVDRAPTATPTALAEITANNPASASNSASATCTLIPGPIVLPP